MILQMVDLARHLEFPAIYQADDRARLSTTEFDLGERMITIGHTLVNGEGFVPFEFNDIAVGRKSCTGQGLYCQRISHRFCR